MVSGGCSLGFASENIHRSPLDIRYVPSIAVNILKSSYIDDKLAWSYQVAHITNICCQRIGVMKKSFVIFTKFCLCSVFQCIYSVLLFVLCHVLD
jgi:hypothetical protein